MLEIFVLVFSIVSLILLATTSWIVVDEEKYLNLNFKVPFFPNPARGHFIVTGLRQGIQARVWTAGVQFIPFVQILAELKQAPLATIIKFALVVAKDGEPLKPGQLVAERVVECDNFLDGAAFIRKGGQRGVQIPVAGTGKFPINEQLFELKPIEPTVIGKRDMEIEISKGVTQLTPVPFVGIVTLYIGEEIPEDSGRILAHHVEGHDNFQDLVPHLDELEAGIQEDVLEQGSYVHNTAIVKVEEAQVPFIAQGEIGILISSIGDHPYINPNDPNDPANEVEFVGDMKNGKPAFILKSADKRLRGILPNVLDQGFVPYRFAHPIAYKIILVDITPTAIDWSTREEFQAHDHKGIAMHFEPIEVVTSEGFTVPTKAELVIILTSRANGPKVVALAGSPKGLITDIIVPIFDDIAKRIISERTLKELVKNREEIRSQIQAAITEAIKNYYVSVVSFRISQFDFEGSPDANVKKYVDTLASLATVEQEKALYLAQQDRETARIGLEKIIAEANNQEILVRARLQKEAANDEKEAIQTRAEGLKDLGAVQALVADPNFSNTLNNLSKNLGGLVGK